jgi:predicted tellurium resistance membrane protein TerC
VNEHIVAAIVADDKAEAFLAVEEFDDALGLADDLRRHAPTAAAAAAAAETTAAAAAAEAATAAAIATAAAATAEAVTAAGIAAATAAKAIAAATLPESAAAEVALFTEAVALVSAAPAALTAAPSIETHSFNYFLAAQSPVPNHRAGQARNGMARRRSALPTHITEKSQSRERFWLWIILFRSLRLQARNTCIAHAPQLRQGDRIAATTARIMFDIAILAQPEAWAALATLVVMEVVLGIDNLIFISILSNKLPEEHRRRARRVGISLALIMRLALLSSIAWLVGLTAPVFDLGLRGGLDAHGVPAFETSFSWRDLILIAGGLFLLWKATKEIHHNVDPSPSDDLFDTSRKRLGFGAAIVQILLLDLVFSVDSILTAVGMTEYLVIMAIAVLTAVGVMLLAADPLANFINRNPTVVMLALGFLLMIGAVLIADGFGVHVPKGYIYAAMAFSALVEGLNMFARRARARREAAEAAKGSGGG